MTLIDLRLFRRFIGLVFLYSIGITSLYAQSKAHEASGFAVIDPTYTFKVESVQPTTAYNAASWIYGPAELECWRLQLLQQRKDAAKLNVDFPGVFHLPFTTASYRIRLRNSQRIDSIRFRAVGQGKVFVNDIKVGAFNQEESFQLVYPVSGMKAKVIRFDMTSNGEPPALLIESETLSTSNEKWEWRAGDGDWEPAFHFPMTLSGVPPHRQENPTVTVDPVSLNNGLFDFGKELFGHITIESQQQPRLFLGESKTEALDTINDILEQSYEVLKVKDGLWRTKTPVAFRYLYLKNNQIDDVQCEAFFYPLAYRGAFACSDSTLTRIWMNSAYTLHLCMQDFLLDGMKRDRLPWAGDLAMSMLVNAYTFNEPELVRRSLVALGRAGIKEEDINGIIDYSLWWIISQDHYQLYFDDSLHLSREWIRIKETLDILSARCDSNGFLVPEDTWLFIDWVEQEKWTALQILWWWAQKSGVNLAYRVGDIETENRWRKSSEQVKINLLKYAWSEEHQIWLSGVASSSENTRHPNFLSVVSGLATEKQFRGIRDFLENDNIKSVGTPYMAGFENMALARLGNIEYMLNQVAGYWGGMLQQGATTFWEAYDPAQQGKAHFEFYDRPYAKSLCHAWSAGPAAFLPSEIFGLKPLEDGWKRFSLNPNPGYLDWAYVCVPTGFGNIMVNIDKQNIEITLPAGTLLEWRGRSITGPSVVKDVW